MNDDQTPQTSAPASLDEIIRDVANDTVAPSDTVSDSTSRMEPDSVAPSPSNSPTSAPDGVKRGRGRPPLTEEEKAAKKNKKRPKIDGVKPSAAEFENEKAKQANIESCAEVATQLVSMSGMMLGGEAAKMQQNEYIASRHGFIAYFHEKGIDNIPSWVILAGALTPYYLRILATTPAKHTVGGLLKKIGGGIKNIFSKRKNARFNSGNDSKRENDTSAEISESSAPERT